MLVPFFLFLYKVLHVTLLYLPFSTNLQPGGLGLPATDLTNTGYHFLYFPSICGLIFSSPSPTNCPQSNLVCKSFLPCLVLFCHIIATYLIFAEQ